MQMFLVIKFNNNNVHVFLCNYTQEKNKKIACVNGLIVDVISSKNTKTLILLCSYFLLLIFLPIK